MRAHTWLLLTLSAILYPLGFIASAYLWWLMFVFLVPLFYVVLTDQVRFKGGYYWGAIALALHLSDVLYSIAMMASGHFVYRLVPALGIVLYEALFSGIIFEVTYRLTRVLPVRYNLLTRLALWVSALAFYFYWMDSYCLWLFGLREGYFFMHPLVPLARSPQLLSLLPVVGKIILTLLLCITNALLALIFFERRYVIKLLLLGGALMPWMLSWYTAPREASIKPPVWTNTMAVIAERFYSPVELSKLAAGVGWRIKEVLAEKPDTELVILPEGALHQCNLSTVPELGYYWSSKAVGKPITLVVGAARWEEENYYNTLYLFRDGKLITWFDKRHGMLLVERLAWYWDCKLFRNMYFTITPPITVAQNQRVPWHILPGAAVVPYICSKLFFNEKPDDSYQTVPILALCSDIWLKIGYVRDLMYLVARFKAIQWQRDVLYISYKYHVYITKTGTVYFLS